jgi:hypothetical protein
MGRGQLLGILISSGEPENVDSQPSGLRHFNVIAFMSSSPMTILCSMVMELTYLKTLPACQLEKSGFSICGSLLSCASSVSAASIPSLSPAIPYEKQRGFSLL